MTGMALLIYISGNRPAVLRKRQEVFHCINTRELHDNLSKTREMVAVNK